MTRTVEVTIKVTIQMPDDDQTIAAPFVHKALSLAFGNGMFDGEGSAQKEAMFDLPFRWSIVPVQAHVAVHGTTTLE